MKTTPITLTTDQIQAALAGRLTQFRMALEPQPHQFIWMFKQTNDGSWQGYERDSDRNRTRGPVVACPWGVVGDQLTWQCKRCLHSAKPGTLIGDPECSYCQGSGRISDPESDYSDGLMDCYNCFRVKCTDCQGSGRITLELTGVRVERLANMTEADALACGIKPRAISFHGHGDELANPMGDYRNQWKEQYGHRHPWASSPWCWVLDVRRVEQGEVR